MPVHSDTNGIGAQIPTEKYGVMSPFHAGGSLGLPGLRAASEITQDVREYAREQNIAEEKALAVGMAEKAKEFVATGGEIYHGNLPEEAKEHY